MRVPFAVMGLLLMVTGAFLLLASVLPFPFRLPGDIVLKRGNFTLYFPITTSIIVSVFLTLVLALLTRFRWPF